MKVILKAESCAGCRTCELACSLHHQNIFQPSIASIEIKENQKKNRQKIFEIHIYKEAYEEHLGCNKCRGLLEPQCVRYCGESRVKEELKSLLQA